jgi:hypothetical protein
MNKNAEKMIKVAFCVAYDWYYLKYSLPLVYKSADMICLAIDKDRTSWAGNPYPFDEQGFTELVRKIDVDKKIKIYEDCFSLPHLAPMQNEVRQRNLMADFMGRDSGWHIQLDTDEYFVNFDKFVHFLKQKSYRRPINICCPWIVLYKQIPEGFLYVNNRVFKNIEFVPVATNKPNYQFGRGNGYFNIRTDYVILHQSWARSEEEVYQKLSNWGHKNDGDINAYYNLWKSANINTYKNFRNFNMINPTAWPELALIPASESQDILEVLQSGLCEDFEISQWDLMKANSLWLSRLNKLKNKLSIIWKR